MTANASGTTYVYDSNLAPSIGPTISFAVPNGGPSRANLGASTALAPKAAPATTTGVASSPAPPACFDHFTAFQMPSSTETSPAPSTPSTGLSLTPLHTPTSSTSDRTYVSPYPMITDSSIFYPSPQPTLEQNGQFQGSFTVGSRANRLPSVPLIESMTLEQVQMVHPELFDQLSLTENTQDDGLDDPPHNIVAESQPIASAGPLPPEAPLSSRELSASEQAGTPRSNHEDLSRYDQSTHSITPLGQSYCDSRSLQILGYSPSIIQDSGLVLLPPPDPEVDSISPERLGSCLDRILAFGMDCDELITSFFDHLLPHCPILLRGQLEHSFRIIKEAQQNRQPISARSICLVLRVLACATQATHIAQSIKLLEYSKLFESTSDPSIVSLQSILLEAFWNRSDGRLAECCNCLRLTHVVAIELGIHQVDYLGFSEAPDARIQRWVWLTMVVWDWEISEFLGHSRIIQGFKSYVKEPRMTVLVAKGGDDRNYMLAAYCLEESVGVGRYYLSVIEDRVDAWQGACGYDLRDDFSDKDPKPGQTFARLYLQTVKVMALLEHAKIDSQEKFTKGVIKTKGRLLNDLVMKLTSLIGFVNQNGGRMLFLFHHLFSSAVRLANDVWRLDIVGRRRAFEKLKAARNLFVAKYGQDTERLGWIGYLSNVLTELIGCKEKELLPATDQGEEEAGQGAGKTLDVMVARIEVNKEDQKEKETGMGYENEKRKAKENEYQDQVEGGEAPRQAKRRATWR